jgi:hypothetical protein
MLRSSIVLLAWLDHVIAAPGQASPDQRRAAFANEAFNVLDRLADTFGFHVPGPRAFAAGAKFLLSRGYRV